MKKVALVLSSGGARGFAHIGAIEALEEEGYEITSISGASMGALIGGMYAAGKLDAVKEWLSSAGTRSYLSLVDPSLSMNHLVKGDKVMNALLEIMPDIEIGDLAIPFSAIATDLKNYEEVVFSSGSLYDAIRSSISIPLFFKPQKRNERVLIDGAIVNSLPLNRVKRTEGDILVSVNVSAHSDADFEQRTRKIQSVRKEQGTMLTKILPDFKGDADGNFYSMLSKTFSLMIQQNSELMTQIYPPDIQVDIPMNRFGGFDYDKAEKIIRKGKQEMKESLLIYNKTRQ
ncbi:MAG: patatin-like phospholipase family protein [Parabacteroides gordonii]|uniref:patatin-like phospholipase family protein n=1 Tax=Parabacteroides gordonii TaxID=574930 RepID=UPI003A88824E